MHALWDAWCTQLPPLPASPGVFLWHKALLRPHWVPLLHSVGILSTSNELHFEQLLNTCGTISPGCGGLGLAGQHYQRGNTKLQLGSE